MNINIGEIAGFDIGGWRLSNSSLLIEGTDNERFLADWPNELTLLGCTYTLENVIIGATDDVGRIWENGIYVNWTMESLKFRKKQGRP